MSQLKSDELEIMHELKFLEIMQHELTDFTVYTIRYHVINYER